MRRISLPLVALLAICVQAGEIQSDELVVFFPTAATLDASGTSWTLPIHGWIYEPERDSLWRRKVISEIQEQFGVAPRSEEGRRCAARVAPFLADNEGHKRLAVRIAGGVHALERSAGDGHFVGTIRLDARTVATHAQEGALSFEAVTADGDARRFTGRVLLPPTEGVSVVSDIDDTIKVSAVRNRRELLRNTFVRPFRPVPGMAGAYSAWAGRGATFFYLSSSPWQLYEPLAAFTAEQGFPAGAWHLKAFRLAGASLLNLFRSPLETKPPVLRELLARYPGHRFLFVGDSGEEDPEVYGLVAREHPDQVRHIFIRRVEGADNRDERFAAAFADVPTSKWTVFEDAVELRPDFADPTPR